MCRLYRAMKCLISSDRLLTALGRLWEVSVGVEPGAVEVRDDEVWCEAGELQVFSEDHPGYLARGCVSSSDDPAHQVRLALHLLLLLLPAVLTLSSSLPPAARSSYGDIGRLHSPVMRGAENKVGVAGDELNIGMLGRTTATQYNSFQT